MCFISNRIIENWKTMTKTDNNLNFLQDACVCMWIITKLKNVITNWHFKAQKLTEHWRRRKTYIISHGQASKSNNLLPKKSSHTRFVENFSENMINWIEAMPLGWDISADDIKMIHWKCGDFDRAQKRTLLFVWID